MNDEDEVSIIEEIRKYIATCPYLKDGKIGVDFLENEETAYSIEPIPINPTVVSDIDDGELKQFAFVFASRESYGSETVQNMLNTKFYEKFSKWIRINNNNEVFPDIPGIESIECTSTAYAYQTGIDTARYQIQLRIIYYEN